MGSPTKNPPPYAIASVDHALRIATTLQLEGSLTVSEVASRLDVARSTAHRLLAMLVYRDFAVQRADLSYAAGPVLEIATHSQSRAARLREIGMPHLMAISHRLEESANLSVRTGDMVRFIASVESQRVLRVGSREGMVFPAEDTSSGLLLLSGLSDEALDALYSRSGDSEGPHDRSSPDLERLRQDLAKVRKSGFAINMERAEHGVIAIGVPLRDPLGEMIAGVSVSMPSVRYDQSRLRTFVGMLMECAQRIEDDYGRP